MSLDQLEKSEQMFAAQPYLVFACSAKLKRGWAIKFLVKTWLKNAHYNTFYPIRFQEKTAWEDNL